MEQRQITAYSVTRSTHRPRTYYPPDFSPPYGTRGTRGPPSDVPNSEDSEMAPGDPARHADCASDSYSNVATAGEEDELEIRPVTKTIDASTDTSLEDTTINTRVSHHKQAPNEILYLQKLLDGSTRIVRKPGILPIVCYVDASTNVSEDEKAIGGLKELEGTMSKLKIKEPAPYRVRTPDVDDFDQEG